MHTGDPQLHYETLESRARPARVAVLIDSSDIDWHHTALRIIEFLSSIWGGKHSIIVPTDGSTIDSVFWAILERFSPDYVYFYKKTGADIKASHTEEYAARLQQQIGRYESGFPTLEVERERIDSELQEAWADSFHLGTDLCSQIADRLVPFHFQKHFEPASSNSYVPHPLTSILDVLPCVDHPQSFVSFEVPPEIDAVWWTAHTGVYPKALSEQLRSLSLNEETIRVSAEELGGFASWIVGGPLAPASLKINEILGGKPGFTPPDQARPTPFDISMSCIGLYGSPLSPRDFANRFALVLGDSISDFCLSYCLPRIGHRAAWLPSPWIDALQSKRDTPLRSCVFSVLYAAPHSVRRGTGVKVCSLSMGTERILEIFEVLKIHTAYGLNGERLNAVAPIDVVTEPTAALIPYCIDSPNHPEIYPFLGDRSVGAIRSPRPNGFSKLSATKHRWVAEVIARSRAVPTIPHIAENLVVPPQPSGTHDIRVSQQALAYACPGSLLIIGDDINANLQNPEIRLFDTFTAVSFIAAANGYACQLSDKGAGSTGQRNTI
ncbi:MAG: hypothetical protein LAN84_08540 [Acidobacteriia bacterium]|nr:hypothetical protein [Terriglobia bacterium]